MKQVLKEPLNSLERLLKECKKAEKKDPLKRTAGGILFGCYKKGKGGWIVSRTGKRFDKFLSEMSEPFDFYQEFPK